MTRSESVTKGFRSRWFALLLAIIILPLTGCLDYREHLVLKKDGSGTLRIDFVVDLGLMGEISKALGEKPDPESMQGPTKAEILQGLEVKGIKVNELEVKSKGNKSKVHLLITFKTLKALSMIEGFGDDRRIDFYEKDAKQAWVVYSFDTTDVIPIEEFSDDTPPRPGEKVDPVEKKILEITAKAKEKLKFRARVTLPGKIHRSNGRSDPKNPRDEEQVWLVDKKRDPKRHKRLGKGKIRMRMLVDKSTLPFVKTFRPLPSPVKKADKKPDPKKAKTPKGPGGLGQ